MGVVYKVYYRLIKNIANLDGMSRKVQVSKDYVTPKELVGRPVRAENIYPVNPIWHLYVMHVSLL
jgi:hypothetical protein